MRAEDLVLELAGTAAARLRPAAAESLLGLVELMRTGDPADVMAAGDLWWASLTELAHLPRLLGESWLSEDALHAALCLRACAAIKQWFEEMSAAAQGEQ